MPHDLTPEDLTLLAALLGQYWVLGVKLSLSGTCASRMLMVDYNDVNNCYLCLQTFLLPMFPAAQTTARLTRRSTGRAKKRRAG